MTEYGKAIDDILAKGASEWTQEESKAIAKLVSEGHRENLRKRQFEVRGGEKPKSINAQEVVS